MGRLPKRDQALGNAQLGNIVFVDPQYYGHFCISQSSRETTTIEEEVPFLTGNGFLAVEHHQ